ncbi:unnamed protein product [Dovyalis caffra]|uniref:Uncharacterized protein n=1 Tax=Dovyalis caffra TaxID=77055 RepID=A0AAV1S711_9ROSI|nr:unnamed protein product [Dovyalis caffra]
MSLLTLQSLPDVRRIARTWNARPGIILRVIFKAEFDWVLTFQLYNVTTEGDNEEGSDVNKPEQPGMPSSTSHIGDAEEDMEKLVPGSEGYVKVTNGVKKVEKLKRKGVKFCST